MECCGNIGGGNITFQESLKAGIPPKLSSLSCNSVFSKYTFDVLQNSTESIIDLSLQIHQSLNPLTQSLEKYLSLGLLGSEDGKNHREPLNLMIVLDVSGSMSHNLSWKKNTQSKLELAKSCVKNIYNKLKDDERLGVVAFNDKPLLVLELQSKKDINKEKFFNLLDNLKADGGTTLEAGYKPTIEMLQKQIKNDFIDTNVNAFKPKNHRIIIITDAMINNQSEGDVLYNLNFEASKRPQNIFTTFIGVGVDFDTDLITKLTKVRGSNYFAVHTDEEFMKILERDFNYIVTPLAFEVYGKIASTKYEIERTHGSDFDFEGSEKADYLLEMKKGGVLRIETLLAYEKSEIGIKGGVILVKLKEKEEAKNDEINEDYNIVVSVEYEDLDGKKLEVKKMIDAKQFKEMKQQEFYQSSGGRKALLLSRYVSFVQEILKDEKKFAKENEKISRYVSFVQEILKDEKKFAKENEKIITYFQEEMKILEDETLEDEFANLKEIINLKL